MLDLEYLHKEICGLARAHQAGPQAGSPGAAMVAGQFLVEDHHDLHCRVHAGTEKGYAASGDARRRLGLLQRDPVLQFLAARTTGRMMREFVAISILLFGISAPVQAAVEIFVSPDGDDGGLGTREQPLRTILSARDAVHPLRRFQCGASRDDAVA